MNKVKCEVTYLIIAEENLMNRGWYKLSEWTVREWLWLEAIMLQVENVYNGEKGDKALLDLKISTGLGAFS